MVQPDVLAVRTVDEYDAEVASGITALMTQLDSNFVNPMSEEHFDRFFRDSDERSILVALRAGEVLGTAVMSTIVEQTADSLSGYMGGFVVDEKARGSGAAIALWSGMKRWCRERDLPGFAFNTETSRKDAVSFYKKMGAQLIEGTDSHYIADATEGAVPDGILYGFAGYKHITVEPLGEGLVNATFLARTRDGKSILQRLSLVFNEDLVHDTTVITEHLATHGWEVPQQLLAQNGQVCVRDNDGALWRQLSYIESDSARPETLDIQTLSEVGSLLGCWHQTLAELDYEPSFTIPHFHDTGYHAQQLRDKLTALPDVETREFAHSILTAYKELPALPDTGNQLIHGDPQLTNMLFRDGKPFTYVDLDTTMHGSVWFDVGDLLRATLEDDLKVSRQPELEKLRPIIEGYRLAAQPETDADEFYEAALTATQHIALELAMRFVNDIVDDDYFVWDDSRFTSRRDNHLHRAGWQWQIYSALQTERKA